MGRVIKRTVHTNDPEIAKEWREAGWEVSSEPPPELVGGPYHILTGANLIKHEPSHVDNMNEALEILRTCSPA